MEDITFVSSLTEDEMMENFKDVDVASGIIAGLEEALAYEAYEKDRKAAMAGLGALLVACPAVVARFFGVF